jgi:hypothetical protein
MNIIRRVSPLSLARVQGLIMAGVGLLFGVVFAGFGTLIGTVAKSQGDGGLGVLAGFFGLGMVLVLPVFYGAIGFVGGFIAGWLYNLAAKYVGGIQVEMEEA